MQYLEKLSNYIFYENIPTEYVIKLLIELDVDDDVICPFCDNGIVLKYTGSIDGDTEYKECPQCNGTGYVRLKDLLEYALEEIEYMKKQKSTFESNEDEIVF